MGGAIDQLHLLLRDLICVNVILRAQLGQRLIALDCRQSNCGIERCRVISSRTLHFCFNARIDFLICAEFPLKRLSESLAPPLS